MRFKTGRDERVELNLTPLIDVVFILLMFFIVTTTFNRHAQLKIELPKASAKPEQQYGEPLELLIDASGRYYLDGRQLVNTQAKTLMMAMAKATHGRTNMSMIISADARTRHQAVVTAMYTAAKVGLTHFSIATTRLRDAP